MYGEYESHHSHSEPLHPAWQFIQVVVAEEGTDRLVVGFDWSKKVIRESLACSRESQSSFLYLCISLFSG